MKLVRNVGAGIASSIWTALVGLAVVPQYLKFLGIEAYGLIGFFATTQALFQILDLGMASTVNREIARLSVCGRQEEVRNLLHTLAVIYWCIAGAIGIFMVAFASFISAHWLLSSTLSRETVTHSVMLMGLVIACRWPIGLYQGALNGLQRIALASAINVATVTLTALGAISVLAFVSRTVDAFFYWQAFVGLCYALALRRTVWSVVGRNGRAYFDLRMLHAIWRFSASMMVLTFSALVFTQLDKILLSKFLSLAAFGQYILAGVVASALSMLITPFYNAIYPKFSAYVANGLESELLDLYRISGRLLATFLFTVAMVIAIAGYDLIRLWTGNPQLAEIVAPLATLLAIGTALHGTMYIPHALVLAQGKTFIPLTINLVLLVIMIPITIGLAIQYGVLGGAVAWLLLHSLYVILGTWLMQRYVGNATGAPWLLHEVGIPLLICSATGMLTAYTLRTAGLQIYGRLAFTFLMGFGAVLATFAASPKMRIGVADAVRAELACLK